MVKTIWTKDDVIISHLQYTKGYNILSSAVTDSATLKL